MKFWLAFPLFALAQASCYDYEYYDPDTQASIPGNACAKQAAAGGVAQPIGQPIVGQTQFGAPSFAASTTTQFGQPTVFSAQASLPTYSTVGSTQFTGAPVSTYTTSALPTYTTSALPTYTSASLPAQTTVYGSTPLASQVTFAAAPQTTVYASTATRLPVATSYAPVVAAAPVAVSTTVRAPVAVSTTVRAPAAVTSQVSRSSASVSSQQAELQYYKDLGERQARQHKQNARIVQDANQDLSRLSLFNRVIAGPGNAAPLYPALRLSGQKDVAEAFRSEKKIANRNAEDAYQRYQRDPSHLNLLVSKYQDLNADLRDAAYQYNVINAGTFGQNIAASGLLGGGLGSSFTISRIITNKQQSEDLEDIQRQMKRIGRQISAEAQAKISAARGGSVAAQGSVSQRLMGMSQYGPQTRGA